ncbi:MAG: hypothetical protein KGY70_11485 [Bacteroidales bacterium]|nr:hypothetical protein [Bacteroidales bacterium]
MKPENAKVIPAAGSPMTDFIRALGLDPEKVVDLTLKSCVGDAVTLEVVMYVSHADAENMTDVVKKFHLEAVEDKPEEITTMEDEDRKH